MSIVRNYLAVYKAIRLYSPHAVRLFSKISCGIALIGLINIATPYLFKLAIDGFETGSNYPAYWLVLVYGLVWSLAQISFFAKNIFAAILSATLERGVSLAMLGKLWQPRLYQKNYNQGASYEKFQRATKSFSSITTSITWTILPAIIELLAAAIMLSITVSVYVSIVLVAVVAMCFFASIAAAKLAETVVKDINTESNNLAGSVLDRMAFSETIALMSTMPFEIKAASARYDKWLKVVVDGNKRMGLLFSGKILIIGLGLCLSLMITAYEVKAGRLSVGDFAMVNAYVIQFSMPVIYLAASVFDIKKNIMALEEATCFLSADEESAVSIGVDASACPLQLKKVIPATVDNKLSPISLSLQEQEIVGIKGRSGIGKSSLFDVLLRFLDYQGEIVVYGQDPANFDAMTYHRLIGGVRQSAQAIRGTLLDNIAYGVDSLDELKLKQACEIACLSDFIGLTPEGLNYQISQNGDNLSGGERMRLAIARLLYRNPKILLLDEPTAGLDTATEKRLMNNLKLNKTTAIVISHSPGCLALCDRIVELHESC
jgi:ATP-binding cassette subfamily B protein